MSSFHGHFISDTTGDIMNHPVVEQSEELTKMAEDIFEKMSLFNTKINLDEIENIGN